MLSAPPLLIDLTLALSSMLTASSFLSRAFSTSRSCRRLASETSSRKLTLAVDRISGVRLKKEKRTSSKYYLGKRPREVFSDVQKFNLHKKHVWSAPVMQGPARMTVTGLRQCIRPLDGLSGDGPGHDGNPRIPLLNSFKTSLGPLF